MTASGGKIAESVPDLAERAEINEDDVGRVLDVLDDERIVRPVAAPPGYDPARYRRFEIFHDVLAPAINRRLTKAKEDRLRHQAAEAEKAAMEASQAAEEESRRSQRYRRLTWAAFTLAIVALALLAFGAVEYFTAKAARDAARSAQHAAQSRQLAADADRVLAQDPDLSAVLAQTGARDRSHERSRDRAAQCPAAGPGGGDHSDRHRGYAVALIPRTRARSSARGTTGRRGSGASRRHTPAVWSNYPRNTASPRMAKRWPSPSPERHEGRGGLCPRHRRTVRRAYRKAD